MVSISIKQEALTAELRDIRKNVKRVNSENEINNLRIVFGIRELRSARVERINSFKKVIRINIMVKVL